MVCKDKWAQWAQDLERITGVAAGSVDGAVRCVKCDRPLLKDGRCVMGHAQDARLPAREPLAVEITDGLLCLFDELYADGYNLEGADEVIYARYALAAARQGEPGLTDGVQGWVLNVWGDEDYEEENLVDRRVIWAETEEAAREEAVAFGDPDWTLTPLRQYVEQHRPAYAPVEGSPQELGEAGMRALLDVVDRFQEAYGLDPDDPRVRAGRALLQQIAGPSPQAPERANLVIVVEGGVVQEVFSNDPGLRITLIDHDMGEDSMPYRNAAARSMSGLDEALRGDLPPETAPGAQAGHLVIVVAGGVVQEVFSDDPGVRVSLVDHDMDEEEGPLLWDRQPPAPFSQLEQEYQQAVLGLGGLRGAIAPLIDAEFAAAYEAAPEDVLGDMSGDELDDMGLRVGEAVLLRLGGEGEPLPLELKTWVQGWLRAEGVEDELALAGLGEMEPGELSEGLWGENLSVALGDAMLRLRAGVNSPELEGLIRLHREQVGEWDDPRYIEARAGAGGNTAALRRMLELLDEAAAEQETPPRWANDVHLQAARDLLAGQET